MNKVKSLEELRALQADAAKAISLRTISENPDHVVLAVAMGDCGIKAGAKDIQNALNDVVAANNLSDVAVIATDCFGYCYAEPMVEVRFHGKDPIRYAKVDAAKAKEIVEKHVMQGAALDGALTGNEVPKQ